MSDTPTGTASDRPAQTIVPSIWSDGRAEEQAAFYAETFRDCDFAIAGRYPTEGLPDFQAAMAGKRHFQQGHDHAAIGTIVVGQQQAL